MPDLSRAVLLSLYGALGEDAAAPQAAFELAPPFSTISHADWASAVRLFREHGVPLLAAQPARACPACGAGASRAAFTSYDGYPFVECVGCGCWYVPREVDQGFFDRYFDRHPQAKTIAQRGLDTRASAENLARDLERIGAYLDTLKAALGPQRPSPRYLDIGAGMGSSLIAARDRGMSAVGIEIDAHGVQVGLSRGVDMRTPAQGLPAGPFDLISLWESLEHISDPLAVLAGAVERLAPGGLLAFTVPNLDSPMARVMREDAPFICGGPDYPGHINLFGPAQSRRLLERAGLELLDTDGQYGSNLPELAGYLLGRHRGASSLLEGKPAAYELPAALARSLMSAGPALELAERAAGLSPILFAVAARRGDPQAADAAARLADNRGKALAERSEAIARGLPDYPAQLRALQREVNLRDEMLQRLEADADALRRRLRRAQWWRYLVPRQGS